MKRIILCSSSPARQALMRQLALEFEILVPDIDETPLANESPAELVTRLAINKAKIHHEKLSNALIIGCDEVAVVNDKIVGKPGNHENAIQMLLACSGREIIFYTGLCLFNAETLHTQSTVETYRVKYRKFSRETAERYLHREKPYQCAGSIKVEGIGIALMAELSGTDPSILTGLPLIALTTMLENEGICVI